VLLQITLRMTGWEKLHSGVAQPLPAGLMRLFGTFIF
jgi:hypothetical protein